MNELGRRLTSRVSPRSFLLNLFFSLLIAWASGSTLALPEADSSRTVKTRSPRFFVLAFLVPSPSNIILPAAVSASSSLPSLWTIKPLSSSNALGSKTCFAITSLIYFVVSATAFLSFIALSLNREYSAVPIVALLAAASLSLAMSASSFTLVYIASITLSTILLLSSPSARCACLYAPVLFFPKPP